MKESFKKRVISSIIIIILSVLCMLSDLMTGLVITGLIAFGLHEFFSMLEKKGILIYKIFGIGVGVIIPLSIATRFEPTKSWELLFIVLALLFLIIMQFMRRENAGSIVGISTTIFGILYISWFMSFMIKIRYMDNGLYFLGLIIMITKLGDMGAYLIGSRWGKTPLFPRISPNKSVEGSAGGLIVSIIAALLGKLFIPFSFFHLAVMGLCLGIVGQLGDLSESLMKRDCQIKDSSTCIPGIGGILDLIDSLLFTAPVFYFYISSVLKS